jgi:hypothetical protein
MKSKTATAAVPQQNILESRASEFVEWLARERPDEYELRVWQVHSRDVQPDAIEVEYSSDEHRASQEAIDAAVRRRERARARAGRSAACDQDGVWQRTSYELRTRGVHVRISTRQMRTGRARRQATNTRIRGSRRRERSTSSSSDDPGPDPEPSPAGRRECECCGLPLTGKRPQARYLNDAHRKRAQRQRDRLEPARAPERRLVLLTEAKAAPPVRCMCDPKGHLVDGGVCVPCGRARGNGGVAWLAGDIPSRQLTVHQPSRACEWRTRPSRSESARLRSTRRDYIDESIIKAVAA